MLALIAPLLLAAAPLSAGEQALVDVAVERMFAPYRRESSAQAAWQSPAYSAETAALIARWEAVRPSDEVDDLSDGDWLCQCQDWDWRGFRAVSGRTRLLSPNLVEVPVRLDIGWGTVRTARLRLKREQGAWVLDDLFHASGMPRGLKQALRETIAADEKLAGH